MTKLFTCTCKRNPQILYILIVYVQRSFLAPRRLLEIPKSISYLANDQKCVAQLELNCTPLLVGKSQY